MLSFAFPRRVSCIVNKGFGLSGLPKWNVRSLYFINQVKFQSYNYLLSLLPVGAAISKEVVEDLK